ncbi:MAG: anti-sigma factor family protein [Myxococcota bacterium]
MNRSKAGARLSAYLEGDLSESERSKLESHLADDVALRDSLRELEGVVALLRNLPEPELPPAFSTRVIARIQDEGSAARGPRVWILRLFEPAVAVPLAAGITALALVIGSQQGTDATGTGLVVAEPTIDEVVVAETRARPSAAQAPSQLAAGLRAQGSELSLNEVQRRTLQTILSRHPEEDLARLLRGSGHPHAESFVTQVVETDLNLQVVSLEQRRGRR